MSPQRSNSEAQSTGTLSVVSTPIGNLEDLSTRARKVLDSCDLIACEDTRRTGRLLEHLGIEQRMLSLHEHNERKRLASLLDRLDQGEHVALVADAGTPLVSDPGYLLVREAVIAGHAVEAVPGPSALLAALVVSGLPPLPFTFAGFPPPKRGRRQAFYTRFRDVDHTVIVYESPHRIERSLEDALEALGDRQAVLARELTKLHEELIRGSLTEIRDSLSERPALKGELVLVIAGETHSERANRPPDD